MVQKIIPYGRDGQPVFSGTTARWFLNVACFAIAAIYTVVLSIGLSELRTFRLQDKYADSVMAMQSMGAELCGVPASDHVVHRTDTVVIFAGNSSTDFMSYLPMLLTGLFLPTISAGLRLGAGWIFHIVMLVVMMGLVAFGLPLLSGFLQGAGAALCPSPDLLAFAYRLSKDIPPMIIVLLLIAIWFCREWVFVDEETATTAARFPVFSDIHWAALGATTILTGIFALALVESTIAPVSAASASLVRYRFVLEALSTGVTTAILVVAIVRARTPRWAWLPLLVLVPLGGEATGAFAMALAAAASIPDRRFFDANKGDAGAPVGIAI
ncbi:MAG TPA: hypothetical protein VHQ47_11150 [Phycisphaerae bacterium]|nr:hypothetical protein [Phycisphaerae bacterium]